MSIAWYWPDWGIRDACSDPPAESCSDAACPLHGWDAREVSDDDTGHA